MEKEQYTAMIELWALVLAQAKRMQESGETPTYKTIVMDIFRLTPAMINNIPDLKGVDIDIDLIEMWLEDNLMSREEKIMKRMEQISQPGEEWRMLSDYPGYYISNYGRVFSSKYRGMLKGQVRDKRRSREGKGSMGVPYLAVLVTDVSGKIKRKYIHRLVAEAFIPNPEGKPCVDHIDEDHTNNRVSNLRWATHRENIEYYMEKHGYQQRKKVWDLPPNE